MSEHIVHVTDDSFENEVLKADGPVLIDFWAEWCGPCKMIAPVLSEIADEYEGKIKIVKMDIENSPKTPMQFGVRSIPTLMIFKDGNVQDTRIGALNKSQLTEFVDAQTA